MYRARSLRRMAALSLCTARSGAHCVRQRSSWRAGTEPGHRGTEPGHRGTEPGHRGTEPGHRGTLWRMRSAAGHTSTRTLCSGPGGDREERDLSSVSVVGSPDPVTWLRCQFFIFLIKLYFEVDLDSEEFRSGAKQALVQVSHLMSTGRFHRLKGLVSDEMMEYVETRTKPLSRSQKLKLFVNTDDIIFLLPEDVTVVFDKYGRKFCSVAMRFWFLTTLEGPEDPEGTKIFRVAPGEEGSQQTKVATAVYEFQRELTLGASPDWTVITVWHWHWTLAPEAPET